MNNEIFGLRLKGYCCSQIIMQMGLSRLEKDNTDLVEAMAGLCNGLWQGKTCGILSAAICLLYLADAKEAAENNVDELTDWFCEAFGSQECSDLLEGNPLLKAEKCPNMTEAVFKKVEYLLEWD